MPAESQIAKAAESHAAAAAPHAAAAAPHAAAAAPSISSKVSSALAPAKAFVVAHPVGLALAGGVLLGTGLYYGVQKYRKKDSSTSPTAEAVAA
jgi:hypothetical protein